MSGSPKTMNRLPVPVFLSSSSPIARSGFIRAWRIVSRPRVEASSPASGSNAKPHTTSRSANLTASLAASRMSSGPTVPNSGPIAIATVFVEPFSPYSPDALDPDAGVRVEPGELEPLGALRVLDAGPAQVVEDARDEGAGVDRRGRLGRRGVLGAIDHDPMGRQALDRERARHADDLAVLVRSIEQGLGLGVAGDRGVDLLAAHALADVGVLGDRLEGHVRDALVDEAAADVARRSAAAGSAAPGRSARPPCGCRPPSRRAGSTGTWRPSGASARGRARRGSCRS